MKIWIKIILFLFPLLLLEGCWDRSELNDLSMISALAIDKAEGNQIQLTVQIIIPQNINGSMVSGGGTGGSASRRTVIRTEKGIDMAAALSKLQRKIPRKLFWGQCKIFIFSEAVAKSGIREQIDFLVRHPQPRERAYMFVSKGNAAEALDLFPPIERTSAEALRKLSDMDIGIRVTLEQLSIMLKEESRTATLPLVQILPTNQSSKKVDAYQTIPYIFGTAVFQKDKMVGEISEKVTRGLMWIKNDIKAYTSTFEVEIPDQLVSLNPVIAHVKLIPKIVDSTWTMTIKVKTEGDIVQNGTLLNPMNPELLSTMDEAFAKDVKKRIQLALMESQQRLKLDILDFAKAFHRKYPKQWESKKDQWDEFFQKIEVNVVVDAHILRPGLINSPGGLPKEETKQK